MEIEIELVNLTTGGRLMRLTDAASGLTIEHDIKPDQPIHIQKQHILSEFCDACELAQARNENLGRDGMTLNESRARRGLTPL